MRDCCLWLVAPQPWERCDCEPLIPTTQRDFLGRLLDYAAVQAKLEGT